MVYSLWYHKQNSALVTLPAQVTLQALQSQGLSSFTVGQTGHQVLVVTDPAQLEALQVGVLAILTFRIKYRHFSSFLFSPCFSSVRSSLFSFSFYPSWGPVSLPWCYVSCWFSLKHQFKKEVVVLLSLPSFSFALSSSLPSTFFHLSICGARLLKPQ